MPLYRAFRGEDVHDATDIRATMGCIRRSRNQAVALGKLDGRMRPWYGVSTCPGDVGCPGARELGASNTFVVQTAR